MIRLGISDDLINQPILYGISNSLIDHPFTLKTQSLSENCQGLLNKELDIAFISPLDYARNSSLLNLVRDYAVLSEGAAKYLLLFFRENLKDIRDVTYLAESQYYYLAQIVLSEFFEIEAEWHQHRSKGKQADVEQLLKDAPVCILDGPEAMRTGYLAENYLDLLDIWDSNTEVCYFHQLLVVREDNHDDVGLEALSLSRELGMRNLKKIAENYATAHDQQWDYFYDLLNDVYKFYPTTEQWKDIQELFNYLYFYGFIDFLPGMSYR